MEGQSTPEVLAWARELIKPAMTSAVNTLPASMQRLVNYHFGWCDKAGNPVAGDSGKAFRPALALLAAEVSSDGPSRAIPAAVAIELVHNFSLVHDDVMDADLTRRHRPTVWAVFGANPAILAGDALLTLAFGVLVASKHPAVEEGVQILSAGILGMVDGQNADVAFEDRVDVNLSECMSMAQAKTGALLRSACALGALFGGASREQIHHLRSFGEHLGLAFQLADDLLGIWGDPAVTGKPAGADLQKRKKSLPLVAALTSGTPAGRELTALYQRHETLSDADILYAAELVERAGGRTWSRAKADELLALALHDLRSAGLTRRATAELDALAQLAVHRDY
jgi:geranylgeranyl diphosphate synthase, type I